MSIDVFLVLPGTKPDFPRSGVLIRKVRPLPPPDNVVFFATITNYLWSMIDAIGIYEALWYPDENDIRQAAQLIEPLEVGLVLLEARPEIYRGYNHPRWGTYDGLLEFLREYLAACKQYPQAEVSIWR